MRILITGSNGMLGKALINVFEGHHIIGVDIARSFKKDADRTNVFYDVDITDNNGVGSVFEKESPDIAIHTAAWTDVDGCEIDPEKASKINAEGARIVAENASRRGVAVIYISTDFVFNGEKNVPYTEEDIASPLSVYGRSKWEGEKFIESVSARYAILRTSWLYGEGGRNFVDTIISKIRSASPLRVVDDQKGSPTYAKDLAEAIRGLVLGRGIKGREIYNISNTGSCTWYEFSLAIKDLLPGEKNIKIEPITSAELARAAARPRYSVLDNSKFSKASGHVLRHWREALAEYVDEKYGSKR